MMDRVLAAIRSLPDGQRMATTLFYINGYSYNEVADFLEVPVSTVKKRLYDSRSKLKERVIAMVKDTLKKSAPDDDFAARVETLVREEFTLPGTGSRSVVDTADVVARTLGFIRRFAPENGTILTDMEQGNVQASPLEIYLIVAPLCVNALQAMDGIGGELEVAVKAVQPGMWGREYPNIIEGRDSTGHHQSRLHNHG